MVSIVAEGPLQRPPVLLPRGQWPWGGLALLMLYHSLVNFGVFESPRFHLPSMALRVYATFEVCWQRLIAQGAKITSLLVR